MKIIKLNFLLFYCRISVINYITKWINQVSSDFVMSYRSLEEEERRIKKGQEERQREEEDRRRRAEEERNLWEKKEHEYLERKRREREIKVLYSMISYLERKRCK